MAIVGIRAVLAIVGYQAWLGQARTASTKDLVQLLSYGQTAYYEDTEGYLSCSGGYASLYPRQPNDKKHTLHDPAHADFRCWRLLAPEDDSPTYASFAAVAGNPGEAMTAPPLDTDVTGPVPAGRPWYVILAVADQDADGERAYWATTSLAPNIVYSQDEYE